MSPGPGRHRPADGPIRAVHPPEEIRRGGGLARKAGEPAGERGGHGVVGARGGVRPDARAGLRGDQGPRGVDRLPHARTRDAKDAGDEGEG